MTFPGKNSHPISFVIPALNEEDVVGDVVRDIWTVVDSTTDTFELILIDDGSTDRTGAIMDQLGQDLPGIRVLHNRPNIGLGASYRKGVAEAKLDYVMMLCGDGGLPATSLPDIIAKVGTADIVVPYMRNLRQIKSPMRFALSRTYTFLMNLLSGHKLHYYNGLPVHRRDLLQGITITSSGFAFQGEILCKLLKAGCSYVEVPTEGGEKTSRSSALKLGNFINVAAVFLRLAIDVYHYRPVRKGRE